jgi:hypothetical protein
MPNTATASTVVSLDEYRRNRGERRPMPARPQITPTTLPTMWVYWVPVWVW